MNFLATISKTIQDYFSEETLRNFQLLSLFAWLYHTKQGCYITHIWEYIFPHFTLRTQQSPLFQCFWKLKQLKLVYHSLSLGSHMTFDSS
jgi:hypothetical protein